MKEELSFVELSPKSSAFIATGLSVIGQIAGIVGFFAERNENRRIIGELEDIKKYLQKLENDIDQLFQQNKQILERLDKLPQQFEHIVTGVVSNALLAERYSDISSIMNNYFNLPRRERRRYQVHTQGWDELSKILTYLFYHENRISRQFELLQYAEFALIASRNQGIKVVRNLVRIKYQLICNLHDGVKANFNRLFNNLLTSLNSQYVESHNLNIGITDLNHFSYKMMPDRPETYIDIVIDCPRGTIPNGGCREVVVVRRNEGNIAFNAKKVQYQRRIETELKLLKDSIPGYINIQDLKKMYAFYLNQIGGESNPLTPAKVYILEKSKVEKDYDDTYFESYPTDDSKYEKLFWADPTV